jgi:hypothetical protein
MSGISPEAIEVAINEIAAMTGSAATITNEEAAVRILTAVAPLIVAPVERERDEYRCAAEQHQYPSGLNAREAHEQFGCGCWSQGFNKAEQVLGDRAPAVAEFPVGSFHVTKVTAERDAAVEATKQGIAAAIEAKAKRRKSQNALSEGAKYGFEEATAIALRWTP